MKYVALLVFVLALLCCKDRNQLEARKHNLVVIHQDYVKALHIASETNKMLFVDFYTSWCVPCKKLNKLIFQNDSIKQQLGEKFVLLKYDAENDSAFHLSKKHHVNSYPTGIVLNNDGFVLNRKYGFKGDDFSSLSKSVSEFTNEAEKLNSQNKILAGYSNLIDITSYPQFYKDYVDRTNTKIDSLDFVAYWNGKHDMFSEVFFSTLLYFANKNIPDNVSENLIKNKQKYIDLFGETDVSNALFFLSIGKLEAAISSKSPEAFNKAKEFAIKMLGNKDANDIFPIFDYKFEETQKNGL